jgi:small nuclear ribonucleoprotein (snRNP)-like protein
MSIFSKALEALGLRVQNGDVPAKTQLVEVKLQTEDCINNKLIYNVNNKNVIVITCNGDKFEGNNVEKEQLEQLKTANVSKIINILTPKQEINLTEKEEKEIVSNFLEVFKNSEDFDIVGEELYFKGIKTIPIPTLIVARFVEIIENLSLSHRMLKNKQLEEDYNSLKMFTLKLLTSPRKESIEQVLSFCKYNDLKISKLGNIIAYRRVNKFKETKGYLNKDLLSFILDSVKKVKTWKKGIKNYEIFNDNGLILHQKNKKHDYNNHIGNLYDLYNNQSMLKEETIQLYTSQHSAGKYTFAIGDVYKAEDGDIDTDSSICHSGGLKCSPSI